MAGKTTSRRRTAAKAAPRARQTPHPHEGLFVVETNNDKFNGSRYGVAFTNGRGFATADQATHLRDAFGYSIEPVETDETAATAVALDKALTPNASAGAPETPETPPAS